MSLRPSRHHAVKSRELFVLLLHLILLFLLAEIAPCHGLAVKVATYNLWNVMFNWDVRKYHIAGLIRESNPDIIGFQEVRSNQDETGTQLDQLKALLPAYSWHSYHSVQMVKPHNGAPPGWEMEGLGILSRHPILASRPQPLTHQAPKDKNHRMVLHATICVHTVNVSVAVVHLSYDRWQQCVNVAEVMKNLRGTRPNNSIVLGDFNTYNDYHWPLEGLLRGYFSTGSQCPKYAAQKNPTVQAELISYWDAWAVVHQLKNGFTFSNMPQPGLESRPDRILFSSQPWRVTSCETTGLGVDYAKKYYWHVMWVRLVTMLNAAEHAYHPSNRPAHGCLHDCGPHGACRCGVCVSGSDQNRCDTCPECSPDVYQKYLIVKVLLYVLVGHCLVSGILSVWQCRSGRKAMSWCTVTSSTRLSKPSNNSSRYGLTLFTWLVWPWCHVRPLYQVFLSGICVVMVVYLCLHLFEDSLNVLTAILPEELNPSDHLMVLATAELAV